MESERYVRDLYDHLIRISDMVDSYRDLVSEVLAVAGLLFMFRRRGWL